MSLVKQTADYLVIDAIFNDNYKKADESGLGSSLGNMAKQYFEANVDPKDKLGSVLNLLAPVGIRLVLGGLGMPLIGALMGAAFSVFHINVGGIFSSIVSKIKSALSGKTHLTIQDVDSFVSDSISSNAGPDEDTKKESSFSMQMREGQLFKIALMKYEEDLKKEANPLFSIGKGKTIGILGKVISIIVKTALAAAGFLAIGEAINVVTDRPSATKGTLFHGKEVNAPSGLLPSSTTQKKYKPSNEYNGDKNYSGHPWIEPTTNNRGSIERLIATYTAQVYPDLGSADETLVKLKNLNKFRVLVDDIVEFNSDSQGDRAVVIPEFLKSKRQIADLFIDNLAALA